MPTKKFQPSSFSIDSTAYGGRPQSLGSSYLFERNSDDANAGPSLSPPGGEKKQESANMEMKSE
jgi:hypothetical protein